MEAGKWYEDAEFWSAQRSILFNKKRLMFTSFEVDKVVKLLSIQPESSILDLGCGIGRHSHELAKKGHKVTAVDLTEEYLNTGRENALKAGLDINYERCDMRELVKPDTYDDIVCMFGSFGIFEDRDDDLKVIKNMYTSLKTNGKLLIEGLGKETVAAKFQEKQWFDYDDCIVLTESKILEDWSRIESNWTIVKDKEIKKLKYFLRLYSAVEFKDLLKAAGFKNVKVFGDLGGAAYDNNAKALVITGEK